MKKSDNQRSRLYRSEGGMGKYKSKLGLKILGNGWTDKVPTTKECQQYIKKVANYEWFTARWQIYYPSYLPDRVPNVGDGRGRGSACWQKSSYTIKLPTWARNEATILHEMAHWIVDMAQVRVYQGTVSWMDKQYDKDHAAHGVEFAAVLLELYRLQLGAEAAKALKAAYKANRVKRDKQPQPIHRKAQKVA